MQYKCQGCGELFELSVNTSKKYCARCSVLGVKMVCHDCGTPYTVDVKTHARRFSVARNFVSRCSLCAAKVGNIYEETGEIHGVYTVVKFHHIDGAGMAHWVCDCICGRRVLIGGNKLRNPKSVATCTHSIPTAGETFGDLMVLYPVGTSMSERVYKVRCTCGYDWVEKESDLLKKYDYECVHVKVATNTRSNLCMGAFSSFQHLLVNTGGKFTPNSLVNPSLIALYSSPGMTVTELYQTLERVAAPNLTPADTFRLANGYTRFQQTVRRLCYRKTGLFPECIKFQRKNREKARRMYLTEFGDECVSTLCADAKAYKDSNPQTTFSQSANHLSVGKIQIHTSLLV